MLTFVFAALGHDVDRAAISIVECGGKPNIPLFARICKATGIPFLVVHDSDRKTSGRLAPAEQALNALIADTAGEERVVVLDPDFEAVAGLAGRRHKPEHAWREFAERSAAECPRSSCAPPRRCRSCVRPPTPGDRPLRTRRGRPRSRARAPGSCRARGCVQAPLLDHPDPRRPGRRVQRDDPGLVRFHGAPVPRRRPGGAGARHGDPFLRRLRLPHRRLVGASPARR